ncbi:porin [Noviherbaspirillum malthae]|jgi:predicted porin|uniref:porin n=1 Tax=Noviherbaspirillum malthae TaxID=1260987 RepID=UPI00188EC63F|nr:porin [Noviherbaspirillum malthae]
MYKHAVGIITLIACSTVSYAQSNVTIYGIVDAGVTYNDFKGNVIGNRLLLDSGGAAGNRIGFRGREDLGNGIGAIFTLENGYSTDTGALGNNGRLFGRQSWVGLESKELGTLALGRFGTFSSGTGTFDMWSKIDPFTTAFGVASLNRTFSSGAVRLDNAIAYRSADFNGLQAGIMYSFQSDPNAVVSENAGSRNNNRSVALGARYAAGPLFAAVTYDIFKPSVLATGPFAGRQNPTQKHLQVGAQYDFGVAALHAAYARQTNLSIYSPITQDLSAVGASGPTDRPDANSYMLGVSSPLGAANGRFMASYQYRDGKPYRTTTGVDYEGDVRIISAGYIHNLSKRTALYATASDSTGKKSLATGTVATSAYNLREYRIGVHHRF